MRILAGDIGGTSARLAVFTSDGARLTTVRERTYPSREYGGLEEIVLDFIAGDSAVPKRVCFGIAGPVREGKVSAANLHWEMDAGRLAAALGVAGVTLINDLAANAYGIDLLTEKDFLVLNEGVADPCGSRAVISAGTGLGEAVAWWDGTRYRPSPSEAGHADFAPRNGLEAELLLYLLKRYSRVSFERVVSGLGLCNIYQFLRDRSGGDELAAVAEEMKNGDPAEVISRHGLAKSCPLCVQALDLFVSLYGSEAGNAALRFLATGGVYVGGGIAPKIVEKLKEPTFMTAFTTKGRLSPLLHNVPVRVILNHKTALLGAGRCAMLGAAGT